MNTSLDPKLTDTKIYRCEVIPAFEEEEIVTLEEEKAASKFDALTVRERLFQGMFYALSGLTAALIIQTVWQIAVLTAK